MNDPSDDRHYYSHDTILSSSLQVDIAEEVLHQQTPNGFPLHDLHLKKHSVIMLLRNMDPEHGHCNGSRYVVIVLKEHTIGAMLISGPFKGEKIMIPRIEIDTGPDNELEFSRFQFPVRLAFAMTAHKSQGQTFDRIGIYLPSEFFSHGQLYTCLSQVGATEKIVILSTTIHVAPSRVQIPRDRFLIKNVVYNEILSDHDRQLQDRHLAPR